jgi:nucleoside-diphosphate-sugar epimerase
MNFLLTGATGFVGSYLLERLLEDESNNIIILKRSNSNLFRIKYLVDKITMYDIDMVDLMQVFHDNKIDGVIHLSTFYTKNEQYEDIVTYIDTNIKIPTQLIHLANQFGVKFFISTGSFFEFDFNKNPISEDSRINPYNLYASSKLAFDCVLKYYANYSSLNIVTLKLAGVYGYNDKHKLISYLMKSAVNNTEVILEKGEHEWDFIYVKDVVEAYIKSIDLCITSKRSIYEEILIGIGSKISIKTIVSIINRLHGHEIIKLEKDYPLNQIFEAYLDNSKAKNMLQWLPQYSIEEGLEETYNLYKENEK